jgi:subtilisin
MSAGKTTLGLMSLIIFLSVNVYAADKRYLLISNSPANLKKSVKQKGGLVVRDLEFTSGVAAHVSGLALGQLKKEFSDLSIIEDQEFHIVDQLEATARTSAIVTTLTPEAAPWGLAAIQASQAQTIARGAGIKVCVIDTGIDKTHPDLAANIAGGKNYIAAKGIVNPNNWGDDNGHGSHVSGTIAAVDNTIGVIGVAPDAKIFAVKALNKRGSGYLSDITDGVYACVAAGAQIINMSLGGSGDPTADSPFRRAVDGAVAAGVRVIVAAGNEGKNISTTTPAGFSSVIAVAAVDSNYNFPYWSNFGLGSKDLTGPGVNILSTWKGGAYNTISGTSMASPHVAGVAALMLSAGKTTLKATDLGRSTSQQGSGLINALQSVQ